MPVYRPRTAILEVPHEFKSRRGSSALWQGALSSLPSLSEETLKALVNIVFRCMVLNTRIFDRVQKLSCENIMLQSYHLVKNVKT